MAGLAACLAARAISRAQAVCLSSAPTCPSSSPAAPILQQAGRLAEVELSPPSRRIQKRHSPDAAVAETGSSPPRSDRCGIQRMGSSGRARHKKRASGISWPAASVVTREEYTYSPAEYDRRMADDQLYSTMCDCCGNDCSMQVGFSCQLAAR